MEDGRGPNPRLSMNYAFCFFQKKKVSTFKNFHLHQQFQKVKKIDAMKQESFLITDDALILQLGHLEIDGK